MYSLKNGTVQGRYISFFVAVSDEDGPKDIDALYVIQDKAELFWKYDSSTWSEKQIGSERWIGSNSLQMPDNSEFPPGTYRLLVVDSGGERDEREVYLPAYTPPPAVPEILLSKDGTVSIRSPYGENYLWLRDKTLQVVKAMKVVPGKISAALALSGVKEKVRTFTLYTVDAGTNTGYILSVDNKYSF